MQEETTESIHTQFCWLHYEVCKIKKMTPFDEETLESYKRDEKRMEMKMQIAFYQKIIEENKSPEGYRIVRLNPELPPMMIRIH